MVEVDCEVSSVDCLVTSEVRFVRGNDEQIYTETKYHQEYWEDYCQVFDRVFIVARVVDTVPITADHKEIQTARVRVIDLPDFGGLIGVLRNCHTIAKKIKPFLKKKNVLIIKAPGVVSTAVWLLSIARIRYAVQVVGDPIDVFSKGATEFRLRNFYKAFFYAMQLIQCRFAIGVAYVTQSVLQKRYPGSGMMASYSDIVLRQEDYILKEHLVAKIAERKKTLSKGGRITICNIGTMEQPYKGQDIIVEAAKVLKEKGVDIRIVLVGEGKYRNRIERMITNYALRDEILLTGYISDKEELQEILDESDLYCHPARTEGLPRAVIEAMARGLPVISTDSGGLKELVESDAIIKGPYPEQLAERIEKCLDDPDLIEELALRGLAKAKEYRFEDMRRCKMGFLNFLRE